MEVTRYVILGGLLPRRPPQICGPCKERLALGDAFEMSQPDESEPNAPFAGDPPQRGAAASWLAAALAMKQIRSFFDAGPPPEGESAFEAALAEGLGTRAPGFNAERSILGVDPGFGRDCAVAFPPRLARRRRNITPSPDAMVSDRWSVAAGLNRNAFGLQAAMR